MRKRSGFSLLELIVVMAVIAIFVAMGVPKLLGNTKQANVTTLNADVRTAQTAVDHYYQKTDEYPIVSPDEDFKLALGNPGQLDFSKLENQLQRIPQTANTCYWWVDHTGGVYASIVDAPDEDGWTISGSTFSLNSDLADYYENQGATVRLYKSNTNVAFNAPFYVLATTKVLDSNLKELGTVTNGTFEFDKNINKNNCYIVITDKNDFSTPPVGVGYEGITLAELPSKTESKGEKLRDPKPGELAIYTVADLQKVGSGEDGWTLGAKYILMSDLNLSSISNWTPIGHTDDTNSFKGTFDGNGFIIKNLTVDQEESYAGLFGRTTGAKITNLGLENANVKGGKYTGGLVGRNYGGTISNSYAAHCTVQGTGDYTGGLVGSNYDGTISNSYAAHCTVQGTRDYCTGGLVGRNYNGTISNSYAAHCTVKGRDETGGLVGANRSSCRISNSYAAYCTVEGTSRTGGLVGHNSGSISNSYAAHCTVQGTGDYTGGLVGRNYSIGTISNSYWDKETINQTKSDGGTARTTAEMMQQSTYSGWNFTSIWAIDEGVSYPYLQSNEQIPHPN